MNTAGRGMGQRVGNPAAVADDIQTVKFCLQPLIDLHLHVVELHFHTVQEGIVVGRAGGNLIQRVDHFNDSVQDPLRQHQTQIAGGGVEGGRDEGILHPLDRGALSADQIAEALHDHTASQHIAQSGNGFTVAVGILEGLGKMLRHQQGKIRIVRLLRGVFIAVTVDGNDAVGVFIDHRALGIHAEGSHLVPIFLGLIDDFALIQLVRQMGEHHRGQLHPDTDVHPVGLGRDIQFLADPFHPLAAAASHGNDAFIAGHRAVLDPNLIAAIDDPDGFHGSVKEEADLVLQFLIQISQNQ